MEMTESFVFWKYLHLMMFVGWVGADMGVFLSCKKACDSTLSFDARMTLLHVALRIELIPRTMWKAALPLGVMLSREMGLLDITNTELALVWAFSIVWWAISMTGAIYYDKPWGQKVAHFANWIIGAVGIGLIAIAITSAMGQGPFDVSGTWLIWKVGLYGLINLTCLGIVVAFDPMAGAFMRLAMEGSTPEIEGLVKRIFNISVYPIWSTYFLVVVVAFIATTKFI
ncbi:MAG: hypothetical protein CL799_09970 [Chromatiales bacterium]|jgi:hypothetical protein|nr:hypothetical protein [Chromatiales bacterium]MDP6150952.1 hypothetical protein [Gammaproteobacteria bacterium]MDP7271608.1 hypothetical protein [Gammaproteobacteria bacterium]HJP05594.1 hypothetical protein [Gammaproteobacteria bacterium]